MSLREVLVELGPGRDQGKRLTAALRGAIDSGRLASGTRLLSTRDLAADLRLARGVVVGAYEQLVAEGRLVSRRGFGTVVAGSALSMPGGGMAAAPIAAASAASGAVGAPPPGPVALRPGVPDLGMFPRSAWRRAYERALATAADQQLDYADPAGVPQLREELAAYLGRVRGARVGAADLVVTTGAAQAMSLLATVLRRRGWTRIAVEDPGSSGAHGQFVAAGLELVGVPVDGDGIVVEALPGPDALSGRAEGRTSADEGRTSADEGRTSADEGRTSADRVGAVFVTPAHQFPLGVVLSPARRATLVRWARATGALIIEDDYDAEFRYDREPVGCVQGIAPDVVALLGSASKALAPGLRRGWLAAPPAWRDEVAAAKFTADLGGSALEQIAFAHFLSCGAYDRHLRLARRSQRARRDALVAALRAEMPQCPVSGVAAGLHLVIGLPEGVDDAQVAAAAREHGLGPLPMSGLRLSDGPSGLVLGYGALAPDELTAAVRTLARLIPDHT